jgi:hypothetical protein
MIPIQIRDRDLNSYLIDQIVRERDVGTHGLLSFIDGQQVFSREEQVIENATLQCRAPSSARRPASDLESAHQLHH